MDLRIFVQSLSNYEKSELRELLATPTGSLEEARTLYRIGRQVEAIKMVRNIHLHWSLKEVLALLRSGVSPNA